MLITELRATEAQVAPVDDGDLEYLNERLGEIMDLIAGSMQREQITRWLARACSVLRENPVGALDEVLDEAIRTCRFPNEVVPFVTERCRAWARAMKRHLDVLRLVERAISG